MDNIFDETEEEKTKRENKSWRDFFSGIIVFVVVILIIGGIFLAIAPPASNTIPSVDDLNYDWMEQNLFQYEP